MQKKNLILIGCGVHAKNTYIPFMKQDNLNCLLVVDIKRCEDSLREYLATSGFGGAEFYGVEPVSDGIALKEKDEKWLDDFVQMNKIDGVIICTEPMYHKIYLDWSLKHGLDIICEKPLTSYNYLNTDLAACKRLYTDNLDYCKLATQKNSRLIIQCQRRYHPAYIFIKNYLKEFLEKYQYPISFIDISSTNGIFNLPHEYLNKENFPYKYGYGKLMHSGYHFVDLFCQIATLNLSLKKGHFEEMDCFTKVYSLQDLLYQFSPDVIAKLFNRSNYHYQPPEQPLNTFGEVDLYNIIQLKNKTGNNILTGQITMMQNTVSRGREFDLSENMHKKSTAIRKEKVTIEVGPLLSIQVYAYQNHRPKESEFANDYFFEVLIHRNTALTGGIPVETIKFDHSTNSQNPNSSYNQISRRQCFMDFVHNRSSSSDIDSHLFPAELVSVMQQNMANLTLGEMPYYSAKIDSLNTF
jgi:Oxidoreductase family, NAD-binding Rossmann fold